VPYVFDYRKLDISKMAPLGDRYLVLILETGDEETGYDVTMGGLLVPEREEQARGWAVGVVVARGDGTRLDMPDLAVVMPEKMHEDPNDDEPTKMLKRIAIMGQARSTFLGEESVVVRPKATVEMYCEIGEVVFVERYSGRQFEVGGKQYRFVNQVDTLSRTGIRLIKGPDGEWMEPPQTPEGVEVKRLGLSIAQ
jgi:co-chaperonin GroES (HSP10)